jgi:hypothetical protein
MTIDKLDDGSVRLALSAEEVPYLKLALQRATFLDTPPMLQKEIYNFADNLLRILEQQTDA